MTLAEPFWGHLDELLRSAEVVIDRPRGSVHPRYPALVYPLDYGYLEGVSGGDGNGLDVWRGSRPAAVLDAVVCTVDRVKNDVEVKLLLGCTEAEKAAVCAFHDKGGVMGAILVRRPPE